nr:unnamed protein product [Callosobruchus analis]
MEKNILNWPNGGLCVGDDAFPLETNSLKPYKDGLHGSKEFLTTVCRRRDGLPRMLLEFWHLDSAFFEGQYLLMLAQLKS